MFKQYLTTYPPALQFVVLCAIVSMSMLLGATLFNVLQLKLMGISTEALLSLPEIPAQAAFKLKLINSVLLIFMLGLPAYLFAYLAYPKPLYYLGVKNNAELKTQWILLSIACIIAISPFVSYMEELLQKISLFKIDPKAHYDKMSKAMLQGTDSKSLISNLLAICLIPAIVEEIFFRGCLQQVLCNWLKKNHWIALLLVAVLFSAFHGQLSGFVPRVFLGLILGLVYYWSGNIFYSIVIHFLNNTLGILLYFFYEKKWITSDPAQVISIPLWIVAISVFVSIWIIYKMYLLKRPFEPIEVVQDPTHIETNNDE